LKQQEMQAKMQQEMAKFQGSGLTSVFGATAPLGTAMPGAGQQVYQYGPNGELVAKQ